MLRTALPLAALVAALALVHVAHADPRAEDPESPKDYIAAIAKGESAFVAKDMPGATAAFQDAIKLAPGRMLALYRLGETQMAQGKYDEAIATFESALGKKGGNQLKGKVMYINALTHERAHKLEAAKALWGKYLAYVEATSDAKGFPDIARQHVKVIERRMKDEVDYAAVKDRIEKRKKEVEAEALENAKKDKNNR